jgi:hypothetical protein
MYVCMYACMHICMLGNSYKTRPNSDSKIEVEVYMTTDIVMFTHKDIACH